MRSRIRRYLGLSARLSILLGTSYFLIATSEPPPPIPPPMSTVQQCNHSAQALRFHVTGTCGAEADITIDSRTDDCTITVLGAGAAGLPSAGRFNTSGTQSVGLSSTQWSISGYLQESTYPSAADAGVFTVVPSDASVPKVTPDAAVFTVIADARVEPDTAPTTATIDADMIQDAEAPSDVVDARTDTKAPSDTGVFVVVPPGTDDAGGGFRVLTNDAGATGQTAPPSHTALVMRSCAYQASLEPGSLTCKDSNGKSCKAVLTRR